MHWAWMRMRAITRARALTVLLCAVLPLCPVSWSSDVRACGTLAAAAGFTLFFAILSLLLSLVILLWGALVASHAHDKGVGLGKGGRAPSLHFHPRLYTLTALLSSSLLFAVLFWSIGAHISLQTHIFVPYSEFSLGSSWIILLVCWLLSLPQLFFFWNVVEFSFVEEPRPPAEMGDDAAATAAGADGVGGSADLLNTTGSDEMGLDLPEEDQQEAYIVRNALTQ